MLISDFEFCLGLKEYIWFSVLTIQFKKKMTFKNLKTLVSATLHEGLRNLSPFLENYRNFTGFFFPVFRKRVKSVNYFHDYLTKGAITLKIWNKKLN